MKFAEIDLFGAYIAPLSVRPPSGRASVLAITEALAQYALFLTGRA